MKTDNFINAVNEIKVNGGSRQTIYISEVWRDRCMTIFSYADGTAEVFEDTRPYMHFNSLAEALLVLGNMQKTYDRSVAENRNRWNNFGIWKGRNAMGKIIKMCSLCLQSGQELPIDYSLLKSKHIYICGIEVEYQH